jgi:sigma-B regulation protein RsbU (phosphoserine phosphatase)
MVIGEPHVRFYAGIPLRGAQGHKIGTLCLVDLAPRALSDTELFSLQQLGHLAEQQLQLTAAVVAQQRLIETQTELARAQQHLTQELREAEAYVRSLLPPPIEEGPVQARWEFEASSTLGGDLFGYHWLDADHFVMYLLDVCGHGVGASLLSSSVQSTLRRQTLPATDFTRPAQVLSALDHTFPMHEHFDKFFTLWYGVYCLSTRTLRYAAAGHPPALLISPRTAVTAPVVSTWLELPALMVGVTTDRPAEERELVIEPGSRLYVFSDGAFEAEHRDGSLLGLDRLKQILLGATNPAETAQHPTEIAAELRESLGSNEFEDDFSLIEFWFGK